MMATGLTTAPAAAEPPLTAESRALAQRMNQLGSETLSRLAGRRGDSTVVASPYGLGSALHLLLLGAAGPVIIESYESTVVVPQNCSAACDTAGNILIELG